MTDSPSRLMIAVVDDDRRILESLESLLESVGYTVRLFTSAATFLSSSMLGQTDCLISDIDLPAMDGFQLSRIVTHIRPRLPVILMTGYPAILSGPQSIRLSTEFRLFKKPFDSNELLTAIREAVER